MKLTIALDSKALRAAIGRLRGPELAKVEIRALEITMNDARRDTVKGFVSKGIGKGIFGHNDKGAWGLIKLDRAKVQGNNVSVKITLRGFAAMQEAGGHIRPHVIRPKHKKMLAFPSLGAGGFGGDLIFAKVINHPGMSVARHESLKPAVQRAFVRAVEMIGRDAKALWDRDGGGRVGV